MAVQAIRHGHAAVWLEGLKLKGGYALTRIRRGKQEAWLLVKMDDTEATPGRDVLKAEPESAITGRSLDQVKESRANKTIAGSGLDVYLTEPPETHDRHAPEELCKMDNVVITPYEGNMGVQREDH